MAELKIGVSIVVPVYAGKLYLEKLTDAVAAIRRDWQDAKYPIHVAELIFVDDGSSDGSSDVLKKLGTQDWVKVITLSRNYGQHPATVAGISYSSGDWVVTLDEDLQHDPKHILDMLKTCVEHQADIVYVKPKEWVHKSAFRDLSSRGAKALISYLTNNPNTRYFNSFRLMRGSIARTAASIASHESFYDVVLSWHSDRVVPYQAQMVDQRYVEDGASGYTVRKLLSHARKLIMTSDVKILRGIGLIGGLLLSAILILLVYFTAQKIFFPETIQVQGWTSLMLVTLSTGGVLAVLLSIIAEYVANLVQHMHGKPTFSVVDRSTDEPLCAFFSHLNSGPAKAETV